MCNLYSITTNQAAIAALFRVVKPMAHGVETCRVAIDRYKTPHPSAMLRIASTLSHKGRGKEGLSIRAQPRRTIAGVSSLIDGAPSCCMALRVSARRIASTRSTPG
jgi:hypothetical protein